METRPAARADDTAALPRGAYARWWVEGLRTAFGRAPRWAGLHATPALVAWLVGAMLLLGIGVERLYIPGPAQFFPQALLAHWLWLAAAAWTCWMIVPRGAAGHIDPGHAPDAASLFAMLVVQRLVQGLVLAAVSVPLMRDAAMVAEVGHLGWIIVLLSIGWIIGAQARLMWRCGRRCRAGAIALMTLVLAGGAVLDAPRWWYPASPPRADTARERFHLTPEVFEAQAPLLDAHLRAIAPQRPGTVDVYAITFAPYAEEDVFLRESRLVAEVMRQRFGAEGRVLQLVNNAATTAELPWATPRNLQRAIERIAAAMDRDEDVLLIHLTSHGAKSGHLSAGFWPMEVDTVTPQLLKAWLDAAGVRHRIVSVSACYSGSWIEPLAGDDALVMTAADADHTSYGCGMRSPMTYFGRAMYDEQLREGWSFEAAHAKARTVIQQREREAGKRDGFSNPQIRVGAAIRPLLARLESERRAAAR